MKKPYRLYNDGLTEKQRSTLRQRAWMNPDRKRTKRWTEKLCTHCRKWHHRDSPETWCQHFTAEQGIPDPQDAAIQVDHGYFHPNVGPGGTWIKNKHVEKMVYRLYGVEPKH